MKGDAWLRAVGRDTEPHRQRRAKEFFDAGERRRDEALARGEDVTTASQRGRWHRQRAFGQLGRIEVVAACGTEILEFTCATCGKRHERTAGCRVHLLCFTCRRVIAAEKRARFLAARDVALTDARRRGLLAFNRRGGRWGERFLTLTAPHLESDTIAGRIERVLAAWPLFLRLLNDHLASVGARSVHWFLVLEWTVGGDGLGHLHFHLWLLSPFLDIELVREWWQRALACEEMPMVDIRAVTDSRGAALEIIKYLTKDIDANGDRVPAPVYAQVYRALDGRRLTRASKGFMGLAARKPALCDCGTPLPQPKRKPKPDPASGGTP